ncbi:hypothetical protein SIN8267_01428 [Sinobacterium norvegicum]|uniref:Conserved hypothetical protein CHP03032 domain-containing protein n=1 Tax=Sinobacterium norvegicum TaxID=1641715 RepID=A0ABM9ADP6_9GAMM|nr:TIGR03032 family protein [Sinobacterium norvegicum]CAH0991325.1 hypothetical protein SIN8267_01428 [Sinobacterium norvegicum]
MKQDASTSARIVGDDVQDEINNPFHLTFSKGMISWMTQLNVALAFTTYTAGKLILAGPNRGHLTVSERNFGRAMAMWPTDNGLLLSTEYQIWRFENGLKPGHQYEQWDKIFLPRACHVTGAVDTHDFAYDKDGRMLAAITLYNCIATIDDSGCFTPLWKPEFISDISGEDRCHLNGFCMEDGELAYASVVGASNTAQGWRDHRVDGGMIIDTRTNAVVCSGLSMPHSPRLYQGKLWILEAGTGWFGYVDIDSGEFIKVTWCPGFTRGLRFFGGFALVGISKPRHKTFQDLPLDEQLKQRDCEPECGVYIINLNSGEVEHRLTITGSVEEIYDVGLIENTQSPMLVGLQGKEVRRWIQVGEDNRQL